MKVHKEVLDDEQFISSEVATMENNKTTIILTTRRRSTRTLVPHSGPGPGGPTAGPNHYHLSGAIYFFHMGVRTNFFYH